MDEQRECRTLKIGWRLEKQKEIMEQRKKANNEKERKQQKTNEQREQQR